MDEAAIESRSGLMRLAIVEKDHTVLLSSVFAKSLMIGMDAGAREEISVSLHTDI